MVQDVFNEKKLIKLEVHQEDLSTPFVGLNSRQQSQRKQLSYDLKFVSEPGFDTISNKDVRMKKNS